MAKSIFGFRFEAMGGPGEIQLYADSPKAAEESAQAGIREIRRIEAKYSRYQESSVLSQINAKASREIVVLDEESMALMRYADACYKASEGLFDITSGVLRRAWDFRVPRLPSEERIEEVCALIGWDAVELSLGGIRFHRPGMEVDFGGMGKEYAVDRALTLLQERGIGPALVNLAGDLRASAPHPNGSPWQIGISHSRRFSNLHGVVDLFEGAVATSGDYERFIEVDGKRYCHILNPRTGYPVSGNQSVTVLAESCLLAGSATTSAFLLEGKAEKFLRDLGRPFCLVKQDGSRKIRASSKQARGVFRIASGAIEEQCERTAYLREGIL